MEKVVLLNVLKIGFSASLFHLLCSDPLYSSDVALLKDPIYLQLVNDFAADEDSLSYAFKHAW